MPSRPSTDRIGAAAVAVRRRYRSFHSCLFLLAMLAPVTASAQGGVLVQGLADAEVWATDSASPLLTRNAGRPGGLARLQLWSAAEPRRGFLLFAQGQVEAGTARADSQRTELYLERIGVRLAPMRAFIVEAGKMAHPIGAFASRRFSTRNPLIGTPDGYPTQYPLGVSVSGSTAQVDYRAAMVSLPVSHEYYVPDPTSRLRPALGAGLTPTAGVHLGTSVTWGPYLNETLSAALLGGRAWTSFRQRVMAVDAEVSRGYLETHAELARSSYDVPRQASTVRGLTYYLEAKYTVAPRIYVAARYERNDYPYIQPFRDSSWIASATNLYNGEAGVGYRVTSSRLLKVTYRRDRWLVDPAMRVFLRDGHALAMQVSQTFDIGELIDRR
jgi:hypothetical protein